MTGRPPYLNTKKWLLIGLCILNIILSILFSALAKVIVDAITQSVPTDQDRDQVNHTLTIVVIVAGVIQVLFMIPGLAAAFLENLCLTVTFIVISIINCIFVFIVACFNFFMWINFLTSIGVAGAVVLFWLDLRKWISIGRP